MCSFIALKSEFFCLPFKRVKWNTNTVGLFSFLHSACVAVDSQKLFAKNIFSIYEHENFSHIYVLFCLHSSDCCYQRNSFLLEFQKIKKTDTKYEHTKCYIVHRVKLENVYNVQFRLTPAHFSSFFSIYFRKHFFLFATETFERKLT